jgi:indole-3-glycerol phosphate synthase
MVNRDLFPTLSHPNRNRIKDTRTLPETQAHRRDILDRIVATKRDEVGKLRPRSAALRAAALAASAPRDFEGALRRANEVALIAEVKRRSPGAGEIRPGLEAAELGRGYAARGAAAISVLTDHQYFGGSLEDLTAVKAAAPVPVLRKDFVIDALQVTEARAAGADAVLLIVRILDDVHLTELLAAAAAHDMAALVEVHDEADLARAAAAGARVIGVNNRDLSSFKTDLAVTLRLLERVPPEAVVISESGIRTREDVERLGREGVHAVLVGETLLRAPDPAEAAAGLAGCRRQERVRA